MDGEGEEEGEAQGAGNAEGGQRVSGQPRRPLPPGFIRAYVAHPMGFTIETIVPQPPPPEIRITLEDHRVADPQEHVTCVALVQHHDDWVRYA